MTLTTAESRELLEKFIVDNQELEELEAKIAEFNIFEAIGVVKQEIKHSNFLAFLLDPSQNHRLYDIFLKMFLKRVLLESDEIIDKDYTKISSDDINVADLKDAVVKREWQNIDIFIHSPRNKLLCVIENKIDSSDYSGQLEKYQIIVEKEYPDYNKILIYLTPKGIEPNDEESKESWRLYSYSKIAEILDTIYTNYKSTIGTEVLTLINHYSKLIKKRIVSSSEIPELCKKIYAKHKQALDIIFDNSTDLRSQSELCEKIAEHKQALDIISENRPDLQSQIAEKLIELLNEGINSQKLHIRHWSKKEIGFCPKKWEKYEFQLGLLSFQFENLPNSLAITLVLEHTENPLTRKRIYLLFCQESHREFFQKAQEIKTTKMIKMYGRKILTKKDYEDSDIEKLMKKVYEDWKDFINDFVYAEKIIDENLDQLIE